MTSFTEVVAAVIVHSSAAAYSHFGVTLEPLQVAQPAPVERTTPATAPKRADVKALERPKARIQALKT